MNITRVWGTADSYSMEFSRVGDTEQWAFSGLPIDLTDAQYAVSIWAENDAGDIGYYAGILYINHGSYLMRMIPQKFVLWKKQPARLILKRIIKNGTRQRGENYALRM